MKNCFIILRNKKRDIKQKEEYKILEKFSSSGYWFDKISLIAYDSNEEITRQLKEIKTFYDNTVIFYPAQMTQTLKDYISRLFSAQFVYNQLLAENKSVYLISADENVFKITEDVIESLNAKYAVKYQKTYVKTIGASIAEIETAVLKAKSLSSDIEFNVYEDFGDATIEILYTDKTPKMTLDGAVRVLVTILGENVYALEDISIAQRVYQLLTLRRMKIAVAESFTGGGVAQKLVEVSGISKVFYEGINSYSNESKMRRLNVEETVLKHHGAVSDETAYQMAAGLIAQGNCDISIATTGIAGPKSDNTNKPVGLCYIAIGLKESVSVYKYVFDGDREKITKTAINHALFLAYKQLK